MKLSHLFYYPIKSLAGIALDSAQIQATGIIDDRQMMLVDEQGGFVTQRKHPKLALLNCVATNGGFVISEPNGTNLLINSLVFTEQNIAVTIWGDQCVAQLANSATNQWFADYLGFKVSLVRYQAKHPRYVDPEYAQPNDTVGFADGFPLLVINQASLDDLNSRLTDAVSLFNFRPNLVINGAEAYAEDHWQQIQIGDQIFDAVKPCSRCVLTTVDPKTGIKSSSGEPLKTLSTYRKQSLGVIFGMNLIPRSKGQIHLNDPVIILK